MSSRKVLVPHPRLVQERLAKNYREARILRSLLRLSVRAIHEQPQQRPQDSRQTVDGQEGGT